MIKLELLCNSVADVKLADALKVDRIELNNALPLGGLTPSFATVMMALKTTTIPIYCMIRPRDGDFVYSKDEFETMLLDAQRFLKDGVAGIVFGCLTKKFKIHKKQTKQLIALAHQFGKQAVFHRAIDLTKNYLKSVKKLKKYGIDAILTSGQQIVCVDGVYLINQAYAIFPNLIVGAGVNEQTMPMLLENCYAQTYHLSAKHLVDSYHQNRDVSFDSVGLGNKRYKADETVVKAVQALVKGPINDQT